MDILNKLNGVNEIAGPRLNIFYGFLTYTTIASCTRGAFVVAGKLIDEGYGATVFIDNTGLKPIIEIYAPNNIKDRLITGGVVPPFVRTAWNNAVAADSKDHPVNGGVSSLNKS